MAALGRRRLLLPAVAVLLLTIASFFYLLPHRQVRQPAVLADGTDPLPKDIPIPRQIWQIFFTPSTPLTLRKPTYFSADWIAMAPGYTYTLVTDTEASAIISRYFSHRPEIGETFHALTNPALKSDFLRYLILSVKGGTYSDVDTKPLVPLESWLPPARRAATRLVIALEYDGTHDRHTDQTTHEVQFCQWTISAAPDHPLVTKMIDRSLRSLQAVARAQGTDLAGAVFTDGDVLNTTGPVAWSEAVLEVLRERDPSVTSYSNFTGIREPRYFGDIVVLPLESFRGTWVDETGPWLSWRLGRRALVRHYYKGMWRAVKLPGQE